MRNPGKLVLDTCALLWLATGGGKLSPVAKAAIDDAEVVLVSAISLWEIGLKQSKGQLELPLPPEEWFNRALDVHGLAVASLSLDILSRANELPWHHRDPADRFIIATAIQEQCPVVTADAHFEQYGIDVLC